MKLPRAPGLIADVLIAAVVVVVPLAFTTAVRDFLPFKAQLLMILVGGAALFAAFDRAPGSRSMAVDLIPGATVAWVGLLAVTLGRSPDGLQQAGYLVALLVLVHLVATRASHWPPRVIGWCVAVPFVIGLGWSLAQAAGIGVLPATSEAFGTVHGALVGTVGNPNENAWYLLLASLLGFGLWRADRKAECRWGHVVALLLGLGVVAVIVLARSRAALVAVVVAAGATAWLEAKPRHRWKVGLGLGAAGLIAMVLVVGWGGGVAARGRIYLARIALDLVTGRWGVPAGPGAFARDFPGAQAELLAAEPSLVSFYSQIQHAHADGFEVLYELGLPGLLLLGGLVLVALRRDWNGRDAARAARLTTIVVALLLGVTGYLLFSPAAAVILAVALGLSLRPPQAEGAGAAPGSTRPSATASGASGPSFRYRSIARASALVLVGIALPLIALPGLIAELRLTQALKTYEHGDAIGAVVIARAAVAIHDTADARFFLGNLELVAGDRERAIEAYAASFRALPRPETADNLALAYEQAGNPSVAAHWREAARRLRGGVAPPAVPVSD